LLVSKVFVNFLTGVDLTAEWLLRWGLWLALVVQKCICPTVTILWFLSTFSQRLFAPAVLYRHLECKLIATGLLITSAHCPAWPWARS